MPHPGTRGGVTRLLALAVLASLVSAVSARALVDPHNEGVPDRCQRCHVRVPTAEESRAEDYHLLGETIDATCLRCHVKTDCCTVGQRHMLKDGFIGISHESDVDVARVPAAMKPKTLPLQDRKITCNTCHFHDRQKPQDYKLVRLVAFKATGIDWTPLCADCHPSY